MPRPQFMIIASDGVWDMVSNQYAVNFIKARLNEEHFGAKSLVLYAYKKGQMDNITAMVILFKNGKYHIKSYSSRTRHSTTKTHYDDGIFE